MRLDRRRFATTALTGLAGAAVLGADRIPPSEGGDPCDLPAPVRGLSPMTDGVAPIGDEERRGRIAKAQRLMREQKVGAIVIEPSNSLLYYTGVRWSPSERTFGLVIPANGDLGWVCPAFEEARARELIRFGRDVRIWQEDESPFHVLAGLLRDRGAAGGRIGVEEGVRFFIVDGLRHELPAAELVNATPVTSGCRMFKSAAELALMQRASDMTIAAFKAAFATLHEGTTQYGLQDTMLAALGRVGGDDP